MRPARAADHSPPSSAKVLEELSYTSTPLWATTGPVTGLLYVYMGNKMDGSNRGPLQLLGRPRIYIVNLRAETHSVPSEYTVKGVTARQ
jgi:hypothetical protein